MIETGNDSLWVQQKIKGFDDLTLDTISSQTCFQKWMINDTGAASIRGTLVEASGAVDFAAKVCDASGDHCIGSVMYSDIADGELMLVGFSGIVPVLLKDGTAATRANWAQTSNVAGRADLTNAAPVPATHWQEVGHCVFSAGAGTDVLSYVDMHFL